MAVDLTFRAQLVTPEQRKLYDYWVARAGSQPMPARAAIAPGDIAELLPRISILEAAAEPTAVRYRLAGTGLRDIYGLELTGRTIAELEGSSRRGYWQAVYDRVLRKGRPAQGAVRGPLEGREHVLLFWLRLPLADDGQTVSKILGLDIAYPVVREGEPAELARASALAG